MLTGLVADILLDIFICDVKIQWVGILLFDLSSVQFERPNLQLNGRMEEAGYAICLNNLLFIKLALHELLSEYGTLELASLLILNLIFLLTQQLFEGSKVVGCNWPLLTDEGHMVALVDVLSAYCLPSRHEVKDPVRIVNNLRMSTVAGRLNRLFF